MGTFGSLATQSFHETKNFTCGEGGALLINDTHLVARAEILREKGTDRKQFFRGLVDKYTWVDIGSSYVPSDVLAAFLLAQLENRVSIQSKRRDIWNKYDKSLRLWATNEGVRTPVIPPGCEQSYHLYYLLMRTPQDRDRFLEHMKQFSILSVFHYLPLHLSAMGRQYGGEGANCPVAEHASPRLVRLPFFNDLSDAEQDDVITAATSFRSSR